MKTNAVMRKTVLLAGSMIALREGERVLAILPTNLPNDGRDLDGRRRYFAVSPAGTEILVYADEINLDEGNES